MAKKKTKVVKAKVTRVKRRARTTPHFCEWQVFHYSPGSGCTSRWGSYDLLKEAKLAAESENLLAPVIVKIDISPMTY